MKKAISFVTIVVMLLAMVPAVFAAAVICPVVNTGVFLIGCRLFFWETIAGWGAALGFTNAADYAIFGLAAINFIIEIGVNLVLAPVIVRLIKKYMVRIKLIILPIEPMLNSTLPFISDRLIGDDSPPYGGLCCVIPLCFLG